MKAISLSEYGSTDVLKLIEVDVPTPNRGEVLIKNTAVSVNFVDVQHRQGGFYNDLPLPLIPGIEGAGIIEAVGDDVTDFSSGDRVAYGYMGGNYAEYTVVPAERVVNVPDHLDLELAAATLLQGITAYSLTRKVYPIQTSDWVLIHAAAGGVGSLLAQYALHLGATVIGTVSTQAKADFVKQFGVQHVVRYTQEDFEHVANQLTDNQGVHVVYDAVGKNTFEQSLMSLRKMGYLVIYGQSSGAPPLFDVNRLSGITPNSGRGSLFVTWASSGDYTAERADLIEHTSDVFQKLAAGTLTHHIADRIPLTEAVRAHKLLESRSIIGKLLLIP